MMTPPDAEALGRLLKARPAWTGILSASAAVGLKTHTLLHSGPPSEGPLVIPTLNSAAVACVFEGWAHDLDEADALITSGAIRFAPAQDYNVATPLAAVVSPSMQLLVMADIAGSGVNAFAPLNGGGTGGAPAARYGRKSQEALDLLRFLNEEVAHAIAPSRLVGDHRRRADQGRRCASPPPRSPHHNDGAFKRTAGRGFRSIKSWSFCW
jgi:hypothetical protein